MTYVSKHARFSILDMIPCDVWQEPANDDPRTICSDPDKYLCIVGEEPADYHGNFFACVYSANLYQREHVPASAEYLRDRCSLAPEETARTILAHYIRNWARMEDDDTAALLLEEADALANG